MTEWYEKGYPGGPMVKIKGFPRNLYPPDASKQGKKPSADGPDIEAYKRTVSRAGRWPWQDFDQAFSNNFAHGKAGGNVKDSGVAGVQRQGDIDDTGWIGEKTFNLFRSIIIPDDLPNAGQPAMDKAAVDLVNKAFDMYQGKEPDTSSGTVRQAALKLAVGQLGIKESPPDSNKVKYTSWYGMVGPWCAMFVTWCFETNKKASSPTFVKGSKYAYVPYVVSDARAKKNGLKTVDNDEPIPGDLVCYDWDWNGEYDHIGIFEGWTGGHTFNCIEGNTSVNNNSNGGEVMRRQRDVNSQATVFIRVAEP
jgi:hypothetical protein